MLGFLTRTKGSGGQHRVGGEAQGWGTARARTRPRRRISGALATGGDCPGHLTACKYLTSASRTAYVCIMSVIQKFGRKRWTQKTGGGGRAGKGRERSWTPLSLLLTSVRCLVILVYGSNCTEILGGYFSPDRKQTTQENRTWRHPASQLGRGSSVEVCVPAGCPLVFPRWRQWSGPQGLRL